ncbi:MAG TPA: ribulose-phosphate 3-epimerase [Candidatus Ozemobacteraceae bacterium]|nr:ribulose-phosphate 3-epimerase [Candidatus Ozemobacteraceae bacterium]
MKPVLIAPSILSADFSELAGGLQQISAAGADWVHLDVMDGHFVPNLTFGPPVIEALRKRSSLPFDVHLMIEQPERWLEQYRSAGADRISFHLEACPHAHRYLCRVRELGAGSGIVLNPQTSICGLEYLLPVCDMVLLMTVNPGFGGQSCIEAVIEKIRALRHLIDRLHLPTLIQVDGGIDRTNAQTIINAGADVLVMGSAFFRDSDKSDLVRQLKHLT